MMRSNGMYRWTGKDCERSEHEGVEDSDMKTDRR